jgi:pimeloyl-ACP methyl ester carboxylesterase
MAAGRSDPPLRRSRPLLPARRPGDTLVCIHGFPTSSHDFAPLWQPLSARFDVVAHDLIGLGWSAKPKRPLSVALQADALESLLAALGIERAHLLAHDLGDTVAQELLARQQDGTGPVTWRSATLLNGGLFPETHRALPAQKLLLSPLRPPLARVTRGATDASFAHLRARHRRAAPSSTTPGSC